MSNENMNYVRELVGVAYLNGAALSFEWLEEEGFIRPGFAIHFIAAAAKPAGKYAENLKIDEKALRCANSERAQGEEQTTDLRGVPTTPDVPAQLSPIAADLEGLAVSLGVLAGKVPSEEWEFLKIFRANLRAAVERVAALESNLEVSHA